MTEKKKHFKPLKWEDGEDSAFARVKIPFKLDYHIASMGYFRGTTEPVEKYILYTETDIDLAYIPASYRGHGIPTIPEAKKFAEQHYQGVMQKLDKAIEKLRLRR